MYTWLKKKGLISLVFSPPELPSVPSSYRPSGCVSGTGVALFQIPWESGTGITQRKGASSFPSLGASPQGAESWEPPDAQAWPCCTFWEQPPSPKMQSHSRSSSLGTASSREREDQKIPVP